MNRDIKIGFLTPTDPHDRKSWSGIHAYLFDTLKKQFPQTIAMGPLDGGWPQQRGRIKSFLHRKITGKRYDYSHSHRLSVHYAGLIEKKLAELQPDLLFAPTSSTLVAYLNTSIPIISLSDATVKRMLNYYEGYTNLTAASEREAMDIERRSIEKSSWCLYASEWAASSARNDYQCAPEKIKVVPLGANLRQIPDAATLDLKKNLGVIRFLFLGVDWERKGGPLVLETMKELRKKGIESALTICGCTPEVPNDVSVKIIPFINKNSPEGERQIGELLSQSHYLFLPSKAECFGIVFCEASAYGVPSLTFDTGGIGGAVWDGINGYKAKNYRPDEFLTIIEEHRKNPEKYQALAASSRKLFEEKLNWDAWLKTVAPVIEETVLKARK